MTYNMTDISDIGLSIPLAINVSDGSYRWYDKMEPGGIQRKYLNYDQILPGRLS